MPRQDSRPFPVLLHGRQPRCVTPSAMLCAAPGAGSPGRAHPELGSTGVPPVRSTRPFYSRSPSRAEREEPRTGGAGSGRHRGCLPNPRCLCCAAYAGSMTNEYPRAGPKHGLVRLPAEGRRRGNAACAGDRRAGAAAGRAARAYATSSKGDGRRRMAAKEGKEALTGARADLGVAARFLGRARPGRFRRSAVAAAAQQDPGGRRRPHRTANRGTGTPTRSPPR